jgi:pheromone shutdown protein TraB
MKKIELESSKIYVPEIIIGLADEAEKVSSIYHKINPDLVAIQASEEELKGLQKVIEGEEFEYFMSNYEEIYAKRLAVFGEVKVPPPCYEAAMTLCLENEIPIVGIDMDDMLFADAFCENISGWQLFRHSLRVRRLRRKKFRSKTSKEFVLEWDKEINKLSGFRNLEKKRERYMAREILRLSKEHKRILCVLDLQRAEGVLSYVKQKKESKKNGE